MLPFITQPALAPACYVPMANDPAGIRFVSARNTHLYRAGVAATDGRKATFVWTVQRSLLGVTATLLGTYPARSTIAFDGNDNLTGTLTFDTGTVSFKTNAVFRDPSGFMLIVFGIDTTKETDPARYWLEVDGRRETFSYATYPPLHSVLSSFGAAGTTMKIGGHGGSVETTIFEGVMGQALVVDGLGLVSGDFFGPNIHGVWVPKSKADIHAAITAAGGWGVNGCHLDFADPLNPGKDVSGQGNHWTTSGFDAAGKDTVASSPTNVYATLNPLSFGNRSSGTPSQLTLADGGLRVSKGADTNQEGLLSTLIMDGGGSYVFEATLSGWDGVAPVSVNVNSIGAPPDGNGGGYAGQYAYLSSGQKQSGGVSSAYGSPYTNGATIGVVFGAGQVAFYKDGVPQGGAYSNVFGKFSFGAFLGSAGTWVVNFGQRPLAYRNAYGAARPLCTDNLPEPVIKDPAEGFAQAIANGADIVAVLDANTVAWNGQWVEIIKRRDAVERWRWRFSDDQTKALSSVDAAGKVNAPALGDTGIYGGQRLRVGKRFGVWTGEVAHVAGAVTTVSHGLGTARNAVVLKATGPAGGDWLVRHPDMPFGQLGKLNGDSVAAADGTMTGFTANSFQIAPTTASGTYRVIVFAQRDGYLDMGVYVGNGAANGAFVPTTTRPDLFINKVMSGSTLHACIMDSGRNPANPVTLMHLDSDVAEAPSVAHADFVVGGVKLRNSTTDINQQGIPFWFLAIGRPVGGVCVAPATAR